MKEALSWSDANAACAANGMQLATVRSAEENELLVHEAAGQTVWIGGTDSAIDDTWLWPNGQVLKYYNWAPGEPNNSGGDEHCLQVYEGQSNNGGQWNDNQCSRQIYYVCQTPPPPPPPTPLPTYQLMNQATSWDEARTVCLAQGMQLAIAQSPEENEQLVTAAAGNAVWLGGNYFKGKWLANGQLLSYYNWRPGWLADQTPGLSENCLLQCGPLYCGPEGQSKWITNSCNGNGLFKYVCQSRPQCSSTNDPCSTECNIFDNPLIGPHQRGLRTCKVLGEPHIYEFGSGTKYTSFQQEGLYELTRFTIAPCGCEVVVQAIFDTYNNAITAQNTAALAVAVRVGSTTFQFYSEGTPTGAADHHAEVNEPAPFGSALYSLHSLDQPVDVHCGGGCSLERSGLDGDTCDPTVNTGCGSLFTTGWRLSLPGGAGNLLVVPWLGNGRYWYDTWLNIESYVLDHSACTTGLCHSTSAPSGLCKDDAVFSQSTLDMLQEERGVNLDCRRRLNELPSQPPAVGGLSNYSANYSAPHHHACAAAGLDPDTVLASCNASCGLGMAENCAHDHCATGDSAFFKRYTEICAIDKNEMLRLPPLPSPPPPFPSPPPPPPPSPPPSPLLPCEKLHECKDECASDHVVCKSGCADKKKCKKSCKKDKKKCTNSCESMFKCSNLPSPPPSCEDNTIPGFGSRWCEMNAPDPSFCSNEAQMNKCKKTCGLCG